MITVDNSTKVHSRSSSPAFGNAILQAVPSSDVYLMDCIQGMKHYPDKWFDLAIVDKINMILLLLCQRIFVYLEKVKNI